MIYQRKEKKEKTLLENVKCVQKGPKGHLRKLRMKRIIDQTKFEQ